MAKMSDNNISLVLRYLGWSSRKKEAEWKHPVYQKDWGPKPDLNDPASANFMLHWLTVNGYLVIFAYSADHDKFFLRAKKNLVKWIVWDTPGMCLTQAILSLILKIRRHPGRQPKKREEVREALLQGRKAADWESLQKAKKKANDVILKLFSLQREEKRKQKEEQKRKRQEQKDARRSRGSSHSKGPERDPSKTEDSENQSAEGDNPPSL